MSTSQSAKCHVAFNGSEVEAIDTPCVGQPMDIKMRKGQCCILKPREQPKDEQTERPTAVSFAGSTCQDVCSSKNQRKLCPIKATADSNPCNCLSEDQCKRTCNHNISGYAELKTQIDTSEEAYLNGQFTKVRDNSYPLENLDDLLPDALNEQSDQAETNTCVEMPFRTACCKSSFKNRVGYSRDFSATDCSRKRSFTCCTDACLDRATQDEFEKTLGKFLPKMETGVGENRNQKTKGSFANLTTVETAVSNKGWLLNSGDMSIWNSIYEQYAIRLVALGCLCRSLVTEGKRSCCNPRFSTRLSRKIVKNVGEEKRTVLKAACRDSKHENIKIDDVSSFARCEGESTFPRDCAGLKDGLFGEDDPGSSVKKKKCCGDNNFTTSCQRNNESNSCHGKAQPIIGNTRTTSTKSLSNYDARAKNVEHFILSIQGMTCTGCETKLRRVLVKNPGLNNLKTSLVLSRAEFDLDCGLSTIADVMRQIQHSTEFQCERIVSEGSMLDLRVLGDMKAFLNSVKPDGVTEMFTVGKNQVRVLFDPNIVGARTLLDYNWAEIVELAPLRCDPALNAGRKHARYLGYMTILSTILTIPVLVMAWAPIPEHPIAHGAISLALATLVQIFVAGPFYPKALKSLFFSRVIEMDLLVVLSTSTAYIFSIVSFSFLAAKKPLSTGQFFETSTLLVTLIMVGRFIAAMTRQKAVESISIRSLQTQNAILVDGSDDSEGKEIDIRLLQYGDVFKVKPDSSIPTDGIVISGFSVVNESLITGESHLVEKRPGTSVIAGTINVSGTLFVRLSQLPGDNTISTISCMVDEAKLSKPKMQEMADTIASYFVPVILMLAILTFAIWIAVGKTLQKRSASDAVVQAVTYAITVLVVSCPCAIGLAVPMVIVFSSGIAAKRGVIIKTASAIEQACKTTHIVFDKTGTLTEGKLAIVSEHYREDANTRLPVLLGLLSDNKHPISIAISNYLRSKEFVGKPVDNIKDLPGQGVEGKYSGQIVRGGNARWLKADNHAMVQQVLDLGQSVFCFTIDDVLWAVFGLQDSLRDEAFDVVSKLQSQGISVHIVSGDEVGSVRRIAASLMVPSRNTKSRSSPKDKELYVQNLLVYPRNIKNNVVVFCGDGINDAIALSRATIGVHINSTSDIAQSAADVILTKQNLVGILTLINLSKVSVRRIKFNFGWSFVYNFFAILLAAGVFVKLKIAPEYAGLGELISVVPVIAAAVFLRWSNL